MFRIDKRSLQKNEKKKTWTQIQVQKKRPKLELKFFNSNWTTLGAKNNSMFFTKKKDKLESKLEFFLWTWAWTRFLHALLSYYRCQK
jgi:hypothetical protein